MKAKQEIKVKVELTKGYEDRFTKACLEILKKRADHKMLAAEAENRK